MAFLFLPPEVHLRICELRTKGLTNIDKALVSYLDLPDLAALSQLAPDIAELAADPILHRQRLRIVAPSRVQHSLFRASSNGIPLRPTVAELVQRGVMRGFGIERRWRMGQYLYSQHVSNPHSAVFEQLTGGT